jgi:hypothetical protein
MIFDGEMCSFTLVGAHTALTASHCAHSPPSHYRLHLDAGDFGVQRIEIRRDNLSSPDGFPARDVAIFELTRDVRGVRPAVLASAPPNVGEWIGLLGYGQISPGVYGNWERRVAFNRVASVRAGSFTRNGATGAFGNTCGGDSGGPTYTIRNGVRELLGVHSQGTCALVTDEGDLTTGTDARVDTNRAYIEAWARGDITYAH